ALPRARRAGGHVARGVGRAPGRAAVPPRPAPHPGRTPRAGLRDRPRDDLVALEAAAPGDRHPALSRAPDAARAHREGPEQLARPGGWTWTTSFLKLRVSARSTPLASRRASERGGRPRFGRHRRSSGWGN